MQNMPLPLKYVLSQHLLGRISALQDQMLNYEQQYSPKESSTAETERTSEIHQTARAIILPNKPYPRSANSTYHSVPTKEHATIS